MVETIFHNNRLFSLNRFSFSLSLSPFQKALLFCCLILGPVLEKHLEETCCCKFSERDTLHGFDRTQMISKLLQKEIIDVEEEKYLWSITSHLTNYYYIYGWLNAARGTLGRKPNWNLRLLRRSNNSILFSEYQKANAAHELSPFKVKVVHKIKKLMQQI